MPRESLATPGPQSSSTPRSQSTGSPPAGRVVLLGHHIAYSASPAMQTAGFRAVGLGWAYELKDVQPEGLAGAVAELRRPGVIGANVTIPHKVAVMGLLDGLEGEAVAAGAVNTIRREGDQLIGSNTDVVALRAALDGLGAITRAVVLGAGGSAHAAAVALGGVDVTFVARSPERAAELPGRVIAWSDSAWREVASRADLVLNATPLGRQGELALPLDALPTAGAIIDLVYVSGGTPLERAARERGLRYVDGWSLLLAQGAAAFEAWTGLPAPLDVMRAALERV